MRREVADIGIVGAGFAGSLMAMILARQGRSVVLLEKGKHPRFALGEASTPFANMLFRELARRYDLPRLTPLAKYGPWKRAYPELPTGLKRGFSFFQHHAGRTFRPTTNHREELLVAASSANETSDTHWYRPAFDEFLAAEASGLGVPYFDETELTVLQAAPDWRLQARRSCETFDLRCRFLIDASGPGGFLARALAIDAQPTTMRTNSWSIHAHFRSVRKWKNVLDRLEANQAEYPYPCDDSTLHHLLDDGWMWVIPFENGITSAGFMLDGTRRASDPHLSPEDEWFRVLADYPSIAEQFAEAERITPMYRTGRLQRRARTLCGPNWAMLPHAAYALDALFSIGNAHALLGIERLARTLESCWDRALLAEALRQDERALQEEINHVDALVHACYRGFGRARVFAATSMFYFVGAHGAELARGEGKAQPEDRFLTSHHAELAAAVREAPVRIASIASERDEALYEEWVRGQLAPLNRGGFCDPAKANLYPCS